MDVTSSSMLPMTPSPSTSSIDLSLGSLNAKSSLSTALHVIRTERDALSNLDELYSKSDCAQNNFVAAVATIGDAISSGGRLIVSGLGKSGKVAQKAVATMNSLGIRSAYLHPTEALHGDMGMIGNNDALLLLTFSGRTAEIIALISHLPSQNPRIFITGQPSLSTTLTLSQPSREAIHLPSPIPVSETDTFGLAAPTTSTTVSLALTDALALATAQHLHPDPADVFRRYHPGGSIGGMNREVVGSGRG